jgi:hypothetical protein
MTRLVTDQLGITSPAGPLTLDEQFDIDRGVYLVYLFDEVVDRVILNRHRQGPADESLTVLETVVCEADKQILEAPGFYHTSAIPCLLS